MDQILVYGDSLAWGIVPLTRRRLPFDERWPGVLERVLVDEGGSVRVLEDCLNGRRTAWDDPFKPGRNGLASVAERIEAASPLALVIVALGTNDFQTMHANDAWCSAEGIAAVVRAIRQAPIEPGMPAPPVLVVVPPPIVDPRGPLAPKFRGAGEKSVGLAEAYRAVSESLGCACFDAGTVTPASTVDGIHLDADQHLRLGEALAALVGPMLDGAAH